MSLIVNLLGGPGAGKSTTAAGVFSLLKLHSINCELVTEFAKDLIWEERKKTLDDQLYILAKQHHRLWRLQGKVDVIITDSPIIQSIVYSDKFLREFILTLDASFKNLYYFIKRCKPYNPKGRNQNKIKAKELCDRIYKELVDKVRFNTVLGDNSGVNEITLDILEIFKVRPRFLIHERIDC